LFEKAYTPKWVDYSKHIRVDRAIPVFNQLSESKIPVYTKATAMPNGWAWQIPVGDRIGHGYLYSSRYIDEADAIEEFRASGVDLGESPRVIPFSPGKFSTQWEGNVCAIGLAGGFLEALESTTIHIMHTQIKSLCDIFLPYYSPEAIPGLSRKYNSLMTYMYEDMLDFVSFHYHGGREDTEFWRDYQKSDSVTLRNQERMEVWAHSFPMREDFAGQRTVRFILSSALVLWGPMLCGLGYLKKRNADSFIQNSRLMYQTGKNVRRYRKFTDFVVSNAVNQRDAANHIRSGR